MVTTRVRDPRRLLIGSKVRWKDRTWAVAVNYLDQGTVGLVREERVTSNQRGYCYDADHPTIVFEQAPRSEVKPIPDKEGDD